MFFSMIGYVKLEVSKWYLSIFSDVYKEKAIFLDFLANFSQIGGEV